MKGIAESTGFSSAYHLSKAYKRFYGISPSHAMRSGSHCR
ncbi:MAG: AraC family transcriptional regulator [Kiritimatiellaeota bacterium]|nr:AraC family transcriptional regulator [Kiritimatiellota bacterium]